MDSELTSQDIDTLIESLDAWVKADEVGNAVGHIMVSLMTAKDPEARASIEAEQKSKEAEVKDKTRRKKERSIVLQAKLIQLKDSMHVEPLTKAVK